MRVFPKSSVFLVFLLLAASIKVYGTSITVDQSSGIEELDALKAAMQLYNELTASTLNHPANSHFLKIAIKASHMFSMAQDLFGQILDWMSKLGQELESFEEQILDGTQDPNSRLEDLFKTDNMVKSLDDLISDINTEIKNHRDDEKIIKMEVVQKTPINSTESKTIKVKTILEASANAKNEMKTTMLELASSDRKKQILKLSSQEKISEKEETMRKKKELEVALDQIRLAIANAPSENIKRTSFIGINIDFEYESDIVPRLFDLEKIYQNDVSSRAKDIENLNSKIDDLRKEETILDEKILALEKLKAKLNSTIDDHNKILEDYMKVSNEDTVKVLDSEESEELQNSRPQIIDIYPTFLLQLRIFLEYMMDTLVIIDRNSKQYANCSQENKSKCLQWIEDKYISSLFPLEVYIFNATNMIYSGRDYVPSLATFDKYERAMSHWEKFDAFPSSKTVETGNFIIGRVNIDGNWVIARIKHTSSGYKAYVTVGGSEFVINGQAELETLYIADRINVDWVPSNVNKDIPKGGVPIGSGEGYVGRAMSGDFKNFPGIIDKKRKCMYVGFEGKEFCLEEYEVLVLSPRI